jgi:signal transduction histidine kinase
LETIGKLAGGIVHDFNNILGAIIGYTELALSLLENQPEVTKCLLEVQNASTRATDLVKQILTFSRQNDQTRKPVQPKVALKEALRLLRATIPVMITIATTIDSDAYIMADPIQLHQIIINLCANANHAMHHKGGVLQVQLHDLQLDERQQDRYPGLSPGHYVKLSVADSGIGIPTELQDKIFTPFFTTKKKGEGTGLGLSTVESIVKSYDGKIYLKSQPGQGSTFTILLPAIESRSEIGIKNLIYKPLSPPALSKAIRKAIEKPDKKDQT